jgi:NDP-sugar pyrophosphorylase family protein
VLTAGLGTRLQPLSFVRAKAAVPIAGQPLVWRILAWLAGHEVRRLVLNLHHLPETITARVGDGGDFGVQVRYSWEFPLLGSAGGPRKALPLIGADEDFFIINGDTLTGIDLDVLADQHRQSGALVTLAVLDSRELVTRNGGVVTDSRGTVYGFVPKGPAAVGYHFVGVQMVQPRAFTGLRIDQPAETIRELYPRLIAEHPGSVRAFLATGEFWDVGTPDDYLLAALSIAKLEGHEQIGTGSHIHKTARVADTVIWDDVEVGEGASLTRCILADRVKIPAGASFQNCAIIQGENDLIVADLSHG